MKNSVKQLLIILFAAAATGCGAQKQAAQGPAAVKTAQSETLHRQALEAIRQQRFTIRTTLFYTHAGATKESTAGYITVSGNKGKFHFPHDIAPAGYWLTKDVVDDNAEVGPAKQLKNGDVQFQLKFDGNNQVFRVTLYKGSNECFVQVKSRYDTTSDKNRFRGVILPYEQ